jgi:transposase-like protein
VYELNLCEMKRNKKEVIEEYLKGGATYRELGKKHGVHFATVGKWIRGTLLKQDKIIASGTAPLVVVELQKELREMQLRNKLLEAMLDIGAEQYGIDLRKKAGTKRS